MIAYYWFRKKIKFLKFMSQTKVSQNTNYKYDKK